MAFNLAGFLIAAVLVVVGCLLTYFSLQRALRHSLSELETATNRQLEALAATVNALETRVAGLATPARLPAGSAPALHSVSAPVVQTAAALPVGAPHVLPQQDVSPDLLVVIAAAVTVFLGKKVRIRSAKMLQSPYEIVNPWSQQGRVFVQASHNLRSRG